MNLDTTRPSGSSLGEFLRQERERRSVTIEQVASATKISVRILYSLESDHYAELPAVPFIRGFVTSYCRFVGLDPNETLTRYDDFIRQKAKERPSKETGKAGYAFERKEGEQNRTMLWVVMGGFVIIGGLMMVIFKPALRHSRPSHVERLRNAHGTKGAPAVPTVGDVLPSGAPSASASPSPSASASPSASVKPSPSPTPSKPAPSPSPKPSPKPSPTPSPSAIAEAGAAAALPTNGKPDTINSGADLRMQDVKYKIIFKAIEDVWVRYRVDDKSQMMFPLRKGRILVLKCRNIIRFQVSDPEMVTFNVNGRGTNTVASSETLSQRQQTPTLIFPPEKGNEEPFPGQKPLPKIVPGSSRAAPASETPEQ